MLLYKHKPPRVYTPEVLYYRQELSTVVQPEYVLVLFVSHRTCPENAAL